MKLFQKEAQKKEIFSSLLFGADFVSAALWEGAVEGTPRTLAWASEPTSTDSWDARLEATDEVLATIEDTAETTAYSKVVLGLSPRFLTPTGEIIKDIRPHIKKITSEMELTPIGFVPVTQAILYWLKRDEGVPPSVILIEVSQASLVLSLYRVGALAGQEEVEFSGDITSSLETLLTKFKDLEVLPARILLYGKDVGSIEALKAGLLRYPWTTRANFMHFPKIEVLSPQTVITCISEAGSSELASHYEAEAVQEQEPLEKEDSDVVVVPPSDLGFKKNVDILEHVPPPSRNKKGLPITLPKITLPPLPSLSFLRQIPIAQLLKRIPVRGKMLIGIVGVVLAAFFGFLYWMLPKASVTILELPKSVTATERITIDPTTTTPDAEGKRIPGHVQEKSVTGDHTIAVTGKKEMGDPAKGSVTIYNKSLSEKKFTKGAMLVSGSLKFTLDADVSVASASESVGSITFGKATGTITAVAIGTESNLPSGREFTFEQMSASVAIARNESALSGGTSREVTVVSRADQDAFVKEASVGLVEKAKQELQSGVGGAEKLIDETIETTVTEKTFAQELDEEATQLSGKLALTISGTSYSDDDLKTLLKAFITGDIPAGYTLDDERTSVTITDVRVAKNGTISAQATITGDAVPTLDLSEIQKKLAGKKISDMEAYLRSIPGVAGIEIKPRMSIFKGRMPPNPNNISVGLAIP